jgi:hypothetical protein
VVSPSNVRATVRQTFATCPGCAKEIEAEVVLEFEPSLPNSGIGKTMELTGNVVGIKFEHDCIPGVKRGRGRPPGSGNRSKDVGGPAPQQDQDRAAEHRAKVMTPPLPSAVS